MTINNFYASNFTLYSISFILELSLLFAKHFFKPKATRKFRSVLCHLFFSIFETLPGWCLLVQNNGNMNLWNMLNMHENQWTKFVQSQQYNHKNNISDVVLVSLSSTSERRVMRGSQKSTLELFLQFSRQKLKYSTGF